MASTSCTGIISNPDLAGIGVRLNFYVTILLTAFIPQKKYTDKLLDSLYLNAIFYGLALLITALVQTIERQLDLYHAIIVMQVVLSLQFLHGFGMRRYILAKKKFGSKRKLTIAIQILSLFIFYPWSFYMWVNASRFGPQPECNDIVKFVLVFYTFQATVLWARYLCMTILAMTTFALLCNLIVIFIVHKVHHDKGVQRSGAGEPQSGAGEQQPGAGSDTEKQAEKVDEVVHESKRKSRAKIMGEKLIRLLATIAWVLSILSAVVGVANTELTVHRNDPNVQAGEGTWGFGQIISVIFILPSVIEILVTLDKWSSGELG